MAAEFEAYIKHRFTFRGLPVDRCSRVLFSQLAHMPHYSWGINYPFQFVQREIEVLEGRGTSETKPAKPFTRNPALRGLMHKHFYVPGYEHPGMNAKLAWKLKQGKSRKLSDAIARIAKQYEGDKALDIQGFAREVAHEFVYGRGGLTSRLDGKATGDWLIYMPHEARNYYLCIAKHDEEAFIAQTVELCKEEFPFLKSVASPNSTTT